MVVMPVQSNEPWLRKRLANECVAGVTHRDGWAIGEIKVNLPTKNMAETRKKKIKEFCLTLLNFR